ncbi:MAG: SIS domain-containing protein, partial [Deltaproteobacteria bacterium]|nr:SIS domain-containing protein [Deltaproteobacteria bacterium]
MAVNIDSSLAEHLATLQLVRDRLQPAIRAFAERLAAVLAGGGKLLICGNGGSAADAQHFAAELVGRFEKERPGLAAIALTTDSSNLTAIGNDYGFAQIFSRQVAALATPADLLIGISTSGNSENILRAIQQAQQLGCTTGSLTGR